MVEDLMLRQSFRRRVWATLWLLLGPGLGTSAAATLELYGTFEAMGVIVTLGAGEDSDLDAVATVRYRTGSVAYTTGLPLVRTQATRLVGSLFWLSPGTTYEVEVSFDDPGDVLHGTSLTAAAATRPALVIPAATASYYVSPAGTGSQCSFAAPCSLASGLGQVIAGEEVVLRGGVYALGELSVSSSGHADAPVVIRAYGSEVPVLDGADPQSFVWAAQGSGVYHTTVSAPDTHLVVAAGERLYPYQSLSDLQSLSWGVAGFYASGTDLWVHLDGGLNPSGQSTVVSRFNHALYIDASWVYVIGLTFRHYGQGSWAKAVYLDGADDSLIRGCTFEICDLGIGIKRDAHRNVIEDNQFSDTIFDWPWDAVKDGAALETGGVRMYDPMTGRGTVIRRNTFFDDFDGFGVCPNSSTGTTCETDVYDNLVYDVGDDGVETDGYCANLRLWRNTFTNLLMGISLAPVYEGPVYVVRNQISHTGQGNNSYSGSCFKLNSGYAQSGPMYLYHNTCDAALPGNDGLYIKVPGTWSALVARNNIWAGTRYAVQNVNTSQPVDLDHDDLYTTQPSSLAWWSGVGALPTLAALQAATGQEMNGMNESPGFVTGSYQLEPTSPLVDQGVVIPGINHDYVGDGPDIGAWETQALLFADGFESGDTTEWSAAQP